MKHCNILFLIVLMFLCVGGYARENEEEKEPLYTQLSRGVIRLEHNELVYKEKAEKAITLNVPDGTAFFVRSSNYLYVVSARHAVEKRYDLHARVQCINNETEKNEVVLLKLPRTGWIYNNNIGDVETRFVDVAVMKIPTVKDRKLNCFRYESKASKDHDKNQLPFEDPEPPTPILVFGYPSEIGFELLEQKPLVRLGIISMKTGKKFLRLNDGKFAEERCCLIDARMFSGNSGSPVMNEPRLGDSSPKLLGLVIATNNKLDFGVIEPVSRIRETLDLAKDSPKSGHWTLLTQEKKAKQTNLPDKK